MKKTLSLLLAAVLLLAMLAACGSSSKPKIEEDKLDIDPNKDVQEQLAAHKEKQLNDIKVVSKKPKTKIKPFTFTE